MTEAFGPSTAAVDPHLNDAAINDFISVLAQVETNNQDIVGDNGAAIGPLQIHKAYFKDATQGLMKEVWESCHDRPYSRYIVIRYWMRYCPLALKQHNWEVLARVHNGGPLGQHKDATIPYWNKVQALIGVPKTKRGKHGTR